jgi:hypothetical protein
LWRCLPERHTAAAWRGLCHIRPPFFEQSAARPPPAGESA